MKLYNQFDLVMPVPTAVSFPLAEGLDRGFWCRFPIINQTKEREEVDDGPRPVGHEGELGCAVVLTMKVEIQTGINLDKNPTRLLETGTERHQLQKCNMIHAARNVQNDVFLIDPIPCHIIAALKKSYLGERVVEIVSALSHRLDVCPRGFNGGDGRVVGFVPEHVSGRVDKPEAIL